MTLAAPAPAKPTPADVLATLAAVSTEAIRAAYGPATAAILTANVQAMAGVLREALAPKGDPDAPA